MSVGWFETLFCGSEHTGVEVKPAGGSALGSVFHAADLPAATPGLPTIESDAFGVTVRGSQIALRFAAAETDGFTSGADPGEFAAA
ncbi:hypothetical protein [Nocardia donostiensis]|uniref:Uncharacterized protein n=1 Tax=Nocardia donostiensis TaxID=1538463 RepID=A0A1V2TAB4_9NOCA|nr:hypothetical protein [Nocardia donostiensis]ONM46452.1 hypothetical protein B0T46_22725 [Nocardia donostiensis]OQS14240.1 hypothetical protein B0T36_14570 [Nocardia donostiensis]OQS17507.1 hypothetical protein B0T44_24490 [Nocardia donostiensis]